MLRQEGFDETAQEGFDEGRQNDQNTKRMEKRRFKTYFDM